MNVDNFCELTESWHLDDREAQEARATVNISIWQMVAQRHQHLRNV